MVDENVVPERRDSAAADPYRPPAVESQAAAGRESGRFALRAAEWMLGLPLVLLGLAQCGVAAMGVALSFVTDIPWTLSLISLLFVNGLMLALPGALLCAGRWWAAWFVLLFGLIALALGLANRNLVLVGFGCVLGGLAIAILVLRRRVRRNGPVSL